MMNLSRVFENWFLNKEFSLSELSSFAEETLSRLAANNPADAFDTIIAGLDTALSTLGTARGQRASATSIREARTRATELLLEQIKDIIRRRQGRVTDAFGKTGEEYQAFYPQGLKGYNDMVYAEVESRLATLIGAATAYLPALTAEFTGLKTQWQTVRGTQVEQKGTVAAGMLAEHDSREQIAKALMRTVLTVAAEFVGEEDKASVYFNQSVLYNAQQAAEEPVNPAVPVAPIS